MATSSLGHPFSIFEHRAGEVILGHGVLFKHIHM